MCDQLGNNRPCWESHNRHICGVSSPVDANEARASSSDEDDEEFAKSTTQLEFPEHPATTYDMCLHKPDWCSRRARGIIPGIPKHKKRIEQNPVVDDIMLPVCGREQLTQTSTVAFQKLYGRKKHVTPIQRDNIEMIINPDKFEEEHTEQTEQEKLFTRNKSTASDKGDGVNANNSTNEVTRHIPIRCESVEDTRNMQLVSTQSATQPEVTDECAAAAAEEEEKEDVDEEADDTSQPKKATDAEKCPETPTIIPADCIRRPKSEAFLAKKRHLHGPSDSLYVSGFDGSPVEDGRKRGLRCGYPWSMSTLEHYLR